MNVKWIKLSVSMFDDEKIKLIEQMPDADTILVIWVKLLAQAGKTNASGYIYLSEKIPYTDEMLSAIFNRPLGTVRMALNVFSQFGMLEIDENEFISIANWEKHQNVEGMDKIREQTRKRVAEHRKNKKLSAPGENVTLPVTHGNATELELEEELELEVDKEKDKVPYVEIVDYLNSASKKSFKSGTKATQTFIKARWKEGHRLDDFKKVIDTKCSEWMNTEQEQYLRPQTLFGTKFESYLNQKSKSNNGYYKPFKFDMTEGEYDGGANKQPTPKYKDGIDF